MATELKRMTFVVTPEIEMRLDAFKKEFFYNRSQSDMIRTLVEAGLQTLTTAKQEKKNLQQVSA
jgi:hypothetical protein